MKKNLLIFFVSFLFLFLIFKPSQTNAQTDLLDYFYPRGCPQNFISNGEVFQCRPAGANCFIIQKSLDPRYYEKFCYDNDFLYHYEDTTWADDHGNVHCSNGDEAYFTLMDGNWPGNPCSVWDPAKEGMKWIPRTMNEGECFTSGGTVVGFSKKTGECCSAPYTGAGGGHTMCLTYQGCIVFPTGAVCDNGIALQVAGGAGGGETYYYCQDQGWVGFNRGIGTGGAYTTNELGGTQTEDCLVIEDTLLPVITLPPDFFPPNSLTCTPDLAGERDSRPYYNYNCDLCNLTGMLTYSCATSFTVFDEVTYLRGDVDEWCEEDPWLEREWGGVVSIDPSDTTIPFVGKKGEEDEQKYLADYFEGTNEYYEDYSLYWRDWINYAGVWRKLSPMNYQNQLKEEMVNRALATNDIQEEGIHHYQLEYQGRLCWDMPLLIDALLAFSQSQNIPLPLANTLLNAIYQPLANTLLNAIYQRASYCVFDDPAILAARTAIAAFNVVSPLDIPIIIQTTDETEPLTALEDHLPPNPDEEDYINKWNEWKASDNGKWSKLWQVVPMFSREDTPGMIIPYLGYRPRDKFEVQDPVSQVEKVPHLARLYEATLEIDQLLYPLMPEEEISQKETEVIIASAQKPTEEKVLGEKTTKQLLAQVANSTSVSLVLSPQGCFLKPLIEVHVCPEAGNVYHYVGDCGMVGNIFTLPCGENCVRADPQCPAIDLSTLAEDQTATSCVNIEMFEVDNPKEIQGCDGERNVSVCCTVTKTGPGCGDFESDCTLGLPDWPTCGLPEPMFVAECQKDSITDVNPNDDLCCTPINVDLTAVDTFVNTDYIECGVECVNWDEKTGECKKDACEVEKSRGVSRRVGIHLLHPYLTEIYDQSTEGEKGFFNIFRPNDVNEFEELAAHSDISYSYQGGVAPPIGKFYFPYLGGIQLAKNWVTNILIPQQEE